MCGPVAAELLSERGETAVLLRARFRGLLWLPLAEPDNWDAAAELRAASFARGRPVMLVETILAVVAEIADGLDLRILSA